ncbi:hypothetical protein [Kerstersia similis]|uniref:hypothetical protein n=1 Tax=Kerstersia similis TaxID=206505 RepID=UPI0039EF5912
MTTKNPVYQRRLLLGSTGALSGLLCWWLSMRLEASETQPFWVLALVAAATLSLAGLSLLPRLPLRRALPAAGGLAVICGGLAAIGMGDYQDVRAFAAAPQMWAGLGLLPVIAVPFLAAGLAQPGGWRNYRLLFVHSWDILCAWAAAAVFAGIAWLVLMASSALLGFVGIDVLGQVLTQAPVAALVTGVLIGLGLAVSSELGSYVSPVLLLRLLRLLTPLLLVVMVVFIVALPFRGTVGLSLAALCVCAVFGAATLVSAVIAEDDENASPSPLLRYAARGLGVVMPIFASVALWAMYLRIAQHGLTPQRVCGLTAILVAAGYAFGYLWAVCRDQAWMARVRQANIVMALAMVALAVLWLTRLLSPESLSVWSQVSRVEAGRLAPEDLPLGQMQSAWGKPGQQALERLSAPGGPLEGKRFVDEDATEDEELSEEEIARRLQEQLPSLPAEHPLLAGLAQNYPGWDAAYVLRSCKTLTPAGHPGCLVVFAALDPARQEDQAIVLAVGSPQGISVFSRSGEDGAWQREREWLYSMKQDDMAAMIDELHATGVQLITPPIKALQIGEGYISVMPQR